ncbi:MAG: acyl-CoA dehydrogenase family protein, partial [Planctomycetales bacterium]|nr:acyl-CoA dehydrogenase family protein [Planctomycetales bacterium]
MNFDWTEEQITFHDRMRDFAMSELTDNVIRRDEESEFAEHLWQRAAKIGIQGMYIPTDYGGQGSADIQTAMLGMQALGYGCGDGGLLLALNAQMWAVQLPILHFGDEFQKQRFLPKLCDGTWKGAHGITEPGTGSDVFNMQTTA